VELIKRESALWSYLDDEIKSLIEDGEHLLDHAEDHKNIVSDFSYLVFPFAKSYEGFLKRFFLNLELISEDEYYSDDIRIGRILNPMFLDSKENVFAKICDNKKTAKREGREIAETLWGVWKSGRNLVFHYFPHNFRRLNYDEALGLITDIISAMEIAVIGCKLVDSKSVNTIT
jgi:hypothetical protein